MTKTVQPAAAGRMFTDVARRAIARQPDVLKKKGKHRCIMFSTKGRCASNGIQRAAQPNTRASEQPSAIRRAVTTLVQSKRQAYSNSAVPKDLLDKIPGQPTGTVAAPMKLDPAAAAGADAENSPSMKANVISIPWATHVHQGINRAWAATKPAKLKVVSDAMLAFSAQCASFTIRAASMLLHSSS